MAQEDYSYSHTRCSCRFLLFSRPDPFSGAIHPFPRPFLPTARSVAAAMRRVPRPQLMCTTAAVRPYCGRRTPAQQEKRNKRVHPDSATGRKSKNRIRKPTCALPKEYPKFFPPLGNTTVSKLFSYFCKHKPINSKPSQWKNVSRKTTGKWKR